MSPDDEGALQAVARALAGAADTKEIARRAAREITRLLGADTSVYFLIDERYEFAVAFAGYHVPPALLRPELMRIRIEDLPVVIGEAIERRAPAATTDEPGRGLFEHAFIRSLPVRPQSMLYAPVLEDARLQGALVSYWWRERHVVTEREIQLATAVARQAALALAAEPLTAAEQRYRRLFERSLAGIFRTRRDGHISDCNPAFARIMGYASPAEVIGRHASEFYVTPDDRDRLVAEVERIGAVTNVVIVLKRRDGTHVPVLMNVAVPAGEPERIYEGQILDVTDRERAEAARREADALRSVASLANGAAHSINNPLTVLRGTLELLAQRSDDAATLSRLAPALRAIDEIADVVRRMSQITRLELMPDAPGQMQMLDIKESASGEPRRPPA